MTISCFAGLTGGFIAGLPIFQPPHALFRDDDHFYEMQEKYPKSYLKNCDESYAAAKAGYDQIKQIMKQKTEEMPGDPDQVIEVLVQDIWAEMGLNEDQDLNKR